MSPTTAGSAISQALMMKFEDRAWKVLITRHACARFVQRCRPGLSPAAAEEQLHGILAVARITQERPSSIGRSSTPAFAYLDLGDVAFPLVRGRARDELVLVTALAASRVDARPRQAARRNQRNIKADARRRTREQRRTRQRRHAQSERRRQRADAR